MMSVVLESAEDIRPDDWAIGPLPSVCRACPMKSVPFGRMSGAGFDFEFSLKFPNLASSPTG